MKKTIRGFAFTVLFYSLFFCPALSQVSFIKRPVDLNFQGACSVNAADFNNDGFVDILAAGYNSHSVAWWKNDNNYPPVFTRLIIDDTLPGAINAFPADIDGDGDVDVLSAAWDSNRITVYWNQGDSAVTWIRQVVTTTFQNAHEVKAGNVDGAGGLDIIAASALGNKVSWWQNNGGSPVQWSENVISSTVMGARSVFPVDIEEDGDTDILSAGLNDNDVSAFINEGGNPVVWNEQIIDGNFIGAHWVFSKDMDNDSDMDVLAAGYMAADIAIWYNDGEDSITWTKFILDGNFPGALSVMAANLDGDEFPDAVAAGDLSGDVRIYFNDGTGTPGFTQVMLDPSFPGVWPVFTTDLDNDSDVDIMAASSTLHDIYWWDNQTVTSGIDPGGENRKGGLIDQISPNPFRMETTIRIRLTEKSDVYLELYSSSGIRIRTLFTGTMDPGLHRVVWDGTDHTGRSVSEGIYLCRISTSTTTIGAPIIKIR